jgi:hypothetical protein
LIGVQSGIAARLSLGDLGDFQNLQVGLEILLKFGDAIVERHGPQGRTRGWKTTGATRQ